MANSTGSITVIKVSRFCAIAFPVTRYRRHSRWGKQIHEVPRGRGVGHVIELGGPSTLPQSIDAARTGGHISLIGNQARFHGLVVCNRRQHQDYIAALEQSGLLPMVDRSFSSTKWLRHFAPRKTAVISGGSRPNGDAPPSTSVRLVIRAG